MNKYFSYDPDSGFDLYDTEKEAKQSAQESIDCYRDNAYDGWGDCVESVCWGKVNQQTERFNERTTEQAEKEGIAVSGECSGVCDYQLVDII